MTIRKCNSNNNIWNRSSNTRACIARHITTSRAELLWILQKTLMACDTTCGWCQLLQEVSYVCRFTYTGCGLVFVQTWITARKSCVRCSCEIKKKCQSKIEHKSDLWPKMVYGVSWHQVWNKAFMDRARYTCPQPRKFELQKILCKYTPRSRCQVSVETNN